MSSVKVQASSESDAGKENRRASGLRWDERPQATTNLPLVWTARRRKLQSVRTPILPPLHPTPSPPPLRPKRPRQKTSKTYNACRKQKSRCELLPGDLNGCHRCEGIGIACVFQTETTPTETAKE
ncbi:hypothetical protein M422DRAFT_251549 [Sphaerobolus stellatus SS14]|uniref:Zn(2)-C6 fungal-type domain-containing protein n=1 Tax=Sphaerobolus stellatus (strain SS14) TaxID=990650 RepID=A0A0C9W0J8_SPHS4|nr:hypothetical protein M422DRAFT_251549 [Sphaerobolus stellatus SS14]